MAKTNGLLRLSYGPSFQKTIFESSYPNRIDNYHPGFSLVAEAVSVEFGSLEASINFFEKSYYRELLTNYKIATVPRVYIALGYRYWFFSRVSYGIAFASSYSIGSEHVVDTFGVDGASLTTSAGDVAEYALDSSFQFVLWKTDQGGSFILDARYSKSLTNKSDENSDHLGALFLYRKAYGGGDR